ncbi:MAG: lipoyl(octanoyl) transferase LipB [bacterium]|nr:lipoyl(octanoyl) transferase LipB [bacterium]
MSEAAPPPDIHAAFWGRMGFGAAWELQERLWWARAEGRLAQDILLLLDHNPVLTLGQGGTEENVLHRRSPEDEKEVPIVRVNRGGEVTFHGPGQLMLYAICDLRCRDRDVHAHCRRLEEVFLRYLARKGFEAHRRPGMPGLWVGGEKILALGVGARRWVTMHGVAFNVSTDLRYFDMIHPCGEVGGRVTSLERLMGAAPSLGEVAEELLPVCADVFGGRIYQDKDGLSAYLEKAAPAGEERK